MAEEHPKEENLEEILSDLDNILSDLDAADAAAAQTVQMPVPPEKPGVIPPPPASTPQKPPVPPSSGLPSPMAKAEEKAPQKLPFPKPQPGTIIASTPARPLAATPAPSPAKPSPSPGPPSPAKPISPPPAGKALPAGAPPAAAAPKPVIKPDPLVERFPEPPKAAAPPAPPAKPADVVAPADLKIELAPREGLPPPAPKKEATLPPKKTGGLPSTRPPLEIALPETPAPQAAQPPKPVVAPVLAAPPATPSAQKPAEPPSSGSVSPTANAEDGVPPEASKEFVRRVAALYLNAYAAKIPEFFDFLTQSAQTVSKKPLFLRRVLLAAVDPGTDVLSLVTRVEGVKAVAVLAVIEGLPAEKAQQLASAFREAKIDYREVAPGDMLRRSAAVDILVEIMLLPSEL